MFAGRVGPAMGAIGIDIGTHAVKMLQVRRAGNRVKVVGAARMDAPTDHPEPGWQPSEEQWTAAFRSGGFRGRRCVVCLPRHDVRIQAVRLPRMPEREMRQAAAWEASHRFGLDRDRMQVDCLLTGAATQGGEQRDEVLLIATTHDAIEARLHPLLGAGLRPIAIDTDFGALSHVFAAVDEPGNESPVRVVVEVGGSGSSVLVLRGHSIAFYKQVSVSGSALNAAVVERLQVDDQAAAELRIGRLAAAAGSGTPAGPTLDAATDRAVYEAVRPLLMALVREVVLCLRYYGVTFRGRPPGSITLTGGDGREPMLDRLLSEGCKLPVTWDDDDDTLLTITPQIHGALNRTPGPGTCWAVATGLSVRPMLSRHTSVPSSGSAVA